MLINWLDKQEVNPFVGIPENQLINSLKSFCEEEGKDSLNIITTNKLIANELIRSFSKLQDAFQNLNIRFGWMDNEKGNYSTYELYTSNTIVVGEDKHIGGLIKPGKVKSLNMTNRARNEYLHLGYQRHFASHKNPYSISLGEMRDDASDAETMVRSAEVINFHLDVMRKEDSGSEHSHSAGIDIYDACKYMRLAGMSQSLQLLCINTETDRISEKTADSTSLLVWYFLEGQINKQIETMKQKENDIFLVSSELYEDPIKFVVGHKTGRWWYQHPSTKEYVPCSDKDYKAISIGSLPDSIVALQN